MYEHGKKVKIGGVGGLTDDTIKVYYGGAIRNNVGNVDDMIRDIDATFFHCLSTDQYSQNQKGKDSWCKYNRAIARNETVPPHKPKTPRHLARPVWCFAVPPHKPKTPRHLARPVWCFAVPPHKPKTPRHLARPVWCFVGGEMCTMNAASDPLYILHLARLDMLIQQWQERDKANVIIKWSDKTVPLVKSLSPLSTYPLIP